MRLFLTKGALSESLTWGLNCHGGKMRPDYSCRNDPQSVDIGASARLEVFWKKLPIGKGPAVSLFILDEEILRIDCFGEELGHMHASFFHPVEGEHRLFMPEKTVEAQIERARFELCRNYSYYQSRVANAGVRKVKIEDSQIVAASDRACEIMIGFLASPHFAEMP